MKKCFVFGEWVGGGGGQFLVNGVCMCVCGWGDGGLSIFKNAHRLGP